MSPVWCEVRVRKTYHVLEDCCTPRYSHNRPHKWLTGLETGEEIISVNLLINATGKYARMPFVGYSSAFNTTAPCRLAPKLITLGLSSPPCICLPRQYLLAHTSLQVCALVHHKVAYWVPCSYPSTHMIRFLHTPQITSLTLQMTPWWWEWSQMGMRPPIQMRCTETEC